MPLPDLPETSVPDTLTDLICIIRGRGFLIIGVMVLNREMLSLILIVKWSVGLRSTGSRKLRITWILCCSHRDRNQRIRAMLWPLLFDPDGTFVWRMKYTHRLSRSITFSVTAIVIGCSYKS